MSRYGEITLDWGGEAERLFRLKIGQLVRLQEKTGCGPLGIVARCQVSMAALGLQAHKDWLNLSHLNLSQVAEKTHVREVFIQGLVGAGVALPEADKLVREYVDERPLAENLLACIQICNAHIYGAEDEDAMGESEAAAAASPRSPMANTASGTTASTPSEPPAASPPPR